MALQFGDDAVDEIVEAAPRAVALPALGWLKQSGRAPGWHGGLQPFIEAILHRLLLQQQISSKLPALVAVLSTRQRATGSAFPNAHIPLFRLFYQVEIRRH